MTRELQETNKAGDFRGPKIQTLETGDEQVRYGGISNSVKSSLSKCIQVPQPLAWHVDYKNY